MLLQCSVVRLEIRPPPSVSQGHPIPSRSGSAIFDLYGLQVRSNPQEASPPGKSSARRAGFAVAGETLPSARPPKQDGGQLLAEIEWHDIIVAFAAVGGNASPLTSPPSITDKWSRVKSHDARFNQFSHHSQRICR